MQNSALLLCFEDELKIAAQIALAANLEISVIQRHRFPDGEIKLRLPAILPPRVLLFRSLAQPNEKLLELLLAAGTAKSLGCSALTLISPYLAYMRQDTAFEAGEGISQRIVGDFLAKLFDSVITVDPHLHRISSLQEGVPVRMAIVLSAADLLSDLIAKHLARPILLGPDEEALQWVAQAASRHNFDHGVCRKVRLGDRQVQIALPAMDFFGRSVVLIDDVASSGQTLATAAALLREAGCASVDVAVTHALFSENALEVIHQQGIRHVWSTDCIFHSSNATSVAPLIARAIEEFLASDLDHDVRSVAPA